MSCGINTSPITYQVQLFTSSNCSSAPCNCNGATMDSSCVFYSGANLPCSGIVTGDSVQVALQKIDTQICSALGDFSTYQFNCLPSWYGFPILSESQFVDAITGYACSIDTELSTFIQTTFPAYQTTINSQLAAITSPGITCTSASVTPNQTLIQVLNAYCSKFVAIDTALSLAGVTWSTCFSVPTAPTTIAAGFNLLINQICQIKSAGGASLPTFNNSSNCLNGGASDSLVTTIGYITTRLCSTPVFNPSSVTWGCLDNTATTLQLGFQTIVDKVSLLTQHLPTYSNDFVVTQNDSGDPCQGLHIALATPVTQDRFVAVDNSDSSPSTLVNKLIAGTGITLDTTTTPGTMIIKSSGTTDAFTVKADVVDTVPGYLDGKVHGVDDGKGVTLTTGYNAGTKQVDFTINVDESTLFNKLLDRLEIDTALYEKFCSRVDNCPSPCTPPTNVQVVLVGSSTTTTTLAP